MNIIVGVQQEVVVVEEVVEEEPVVEEVPVLEEVEEETDTTNCGNVTEWSPEVIYAQADTRVLFEGVFI